jgi:hypothetical protein
MIVLVAMTMAGIAIMHRSHRQSDFGKSRVQARDVARGDWRQRCSHLPAGPRFSGTLNSSNPAAGYMAIGYNAMTERTGPQTA